MSDTLLYIILFLGWSLIGFIFVGVAIYTKRYQRKKEMNERCLTSGKIVDIVERVHHSGRGGTSRCYVPVIEFSANNQAYRLENENGVRERDKIELGKSVDVMYDESDPKHFHLTEDDSNETAANSLLRFGVILIAGAAVLDIVCYIYRVF